MLSTIVSQNLHPFLAAPTKEDLAILKELIESGKVTPVIDTTCGLSEVPDAIDRVGKRHTRGKIVFSL